MDATWGCVSMRGWGGRGGRTSAPGEDWRQWAVASVARMEVIWSTAAWTWRESDMEGERSCDILTWRHGWVEMWTLEGRGEPLEPILTVPLIS